MVGRGLLSALVASALLLVGGQSAAFAADDDGIPFEQLVQVYVPDQAAVDSVVTNYDAAEYKAVQDDGSILLNVFVTAEEKAALKEKGYKVGRVIEDSNTGAQRMKERQEIIDQEAVAADVAENGVKGAAPVKGKSIVPGQGDTVIQRAVVFTDAVGPNTGRTAARFLYVEAFNKSTTRVGTSNMFAGPSLALSYAGPDGVYATATNMFRFVDTRPTVDQYMYHRQLIRLTGAYATLAAKDIQLRVATAATAGGAEASVETFPVSEWLGKDLPPHVAGFKTEFFTHYQDPTETRADLDALAAKYPELMSVVNMPEKTSGYQRKSQAIMFGTGAIGSAPPATIGNPLLDTTGEITAAHAVASIPFTATAGQTILATVDAIPSGETDFILAIKDPSGATLQTVDTGTSPEVINRTLTTAGTYTFEISGFQGDLGDFTFKVQPVLVTSAQAATSAVVLTTKDWGHEGGNDVMAEFRTQAGNNLPLSIAVNGKLIEAFLGTNATGAPNSTAKQVVDAINANPAAAALAEATTYRGSAGAGIVPARARTNLSDFLNAPTSGPTAVARGPFQQHLYRIGSHRDGSKVGVFLFCQQHAREWTTSLSCQETAHELVENYATDPQTKQLLDNVEVFISPNSNPDGGHFSMYDASVQRKTMPNYCPKTGAYDPAARTAWGVDMNRNSGEYSPFDGYFGASTSCTDETFQGPSEYSEPETRNEKWVVDTFPNIKFSNNIHSYGGYFMWAPGAYKNDALRTTAPAPNIGVEQYFFQAGEKILKRIKDYRGTVILPERTGPIADVLYSAAGNSADDHWYRKGIIAYSFETGADRMLDTATGIEPTQVGFQPCFGAVGSGGGQGSCPADGSLVNEGHDESMEFAAGNYGLVESAYDYAMDTTPPSTSLDSDGVTQSKNAIAYRFVWNDEAAVIHYTTDGSTPTLSSPTYNNQRARSIGEILKINTPGATTVKWFAVDIKGNQSAVQSKSFLLDQTAPTVTVNIPEGAVYTQGRPVPLTFSCADDQGGSGIASCVGSTPSGSNLPTGTAGMQVLTITATDNVGNVTVKTVNYRVLDATNVNGNVAGTVPATLSLTLGTPATFGALTAGVAKDYAANMTANVISTAGDAALSVADPSSTNTGHLVNGTFALPSVLQVKASSAAGTGSAAFANVGGSSAPTSLLSYSAPISNDAVTVAFQQHVSANDALRTGAYTKTLTFTLSTTTP
jgi:hypothetical protein